MKCLICKKEMREATPHHFVCECGYSTIVLRMTKEELKNLSKESYLEKRHWNYGGGLNK